MRDLHVGLLLLSLVFIAPAVGLHRVRHKVRRARRLRVDRNGLTWFLAGTVDEFVAWDELAEVRVSYARKSSRFLSLGDQQDLRRDGEYEQGLRTTLLLRIDLVPTSAAFTDAHPELAARVRWADRNPGDPPPPHPPWKERIGDSDAVVRVPYGDRPDLFGPFDEALERFAGPRYRRPRNEGQAMGFRYS